MDLKGTMEPMSCRPASALAINLAAIRAILLRDISVQAGPYCTGFLMLLLMPLGHLLAVVAAFKVFGRLAPVGTDQVVYFGLSILPFVIYVYSSRQIVMALIVNKSLLYFNRVKIFDILFARSVLEIVNSIIVVVVLISILILYSDGFSPRDCAGFVFAVAATIYFAFSFGVLNALIVQVVPIWFTLFNLCVPIFWIGSGVVFFPTAIPDPYDQWLAFNPLLQCVEWIRYAYYEDYPDKLLNIPYLLSFSTACLSISLISEKIARRVLR